MTDPQHNAEPGSRLAEAAAAGVPLAPSLRAMAAESPRPVRAALRRVADRVEAGVPPAEAFNDPVLPLHLRGLIDAGVRAGSLGRALDEYALLEQERTDLRRRIRRALAYPTLLLALCGLVFVLFVSWIVPGFEKIFADFGADVPLLTKAVLWLGRYGLWQAIVVVAVFVMAIVLLRWIARPLWGYRLLYALPVIGPVWRWSGLAYCARLLGVLVEQRQPLPEALRLTASALPDPDLVLLCRSAAARVETGIPWIEALGPAGGFPATFQAMLGGASQVAPPAEALRAVAEVFAGRSRIYARLLELVAAPLAFALVLSLVGMMIVALFLPLISLIQKLS